MDLALQHLLALEGAQVVVHGRDASRCEAVAGSIRAAGGIAHVALGDLTAKAEADTVIEQVRSAVGSIDILINNVGGNEAAGGGLNGWFNDTEDVWAGTYQQNVVAAVRMITAFVPTMRERGWGRVINIASAGGTDQHDRQPLARTRA